MDRHAKLAIKYWTAIEAGHKVRWRSAPRNAIDFQHDDWKVSTAPAFRDEMDYEIEVVPRTIVVNGIEVPEPMRKPPRVGETYCLANPFVEAGFEFVGAWTGDDEMRDHWVRFGLVHDNAEAAAAHGKAMRATSEVKS